MDSRRGKHKHRFYVEEYERHSKKEVDGTIPEINFAVDVKDMENYVHMGQYKHNKSVRWFQRLDDLKPDDWVYYEMFNETVTNIGKNFLFKALFLHEDTIPDGFETCRDMEKLCPRCSMFGMTDDSGKKDREAVGFRGRFKSSALVCNIELKEETFNANVPIEKESGEKFEPVKFKKWTNKGDMYSRQFFMPIKQSPKPSKRDVNAYYDQETGLLKGPKVYRHGARGVETLDDLISLIKSIDNKPLKDYSHKLRNYAQVCEVGLSFKGTVGVENCSAREIAALLVLLDHRIAKHGFKIGSDKALGLGSIQSAIKRVWIRNPENYKWESIPFETIEFLMEELKTRLPGMVDDLKVT